jgi:hypothetical protein
MTTENGNAIATNTIYLEYEEESKINSDISFAKQNVRISDIAPKRTNNAKVLFNIS